MYIPIILGTAREGRQSEKVAKFILQETKKFGLETEIIDVRDFRIEATDNTQESAIAKIFSKKITKADGLIIITPEYNHSYSGELKMMLDMLYKQYARKPVGICGVSAGPLGGVRAVEQLKLMVIELSMVPIRISLYFSNVFELFEDGVIKNKAYYEQVRGFLEELTWYARALKAAKAKKTNTRETH